MNTLLLTGSLWMAAIALPSDGLHRERLPADVDFVAHFDMEGFKKTELWQHAMSEVGSHVDMTDFNEFQARYGVNPMTDIRAVTLYRVKGDEDPTVVLFSTTSAVEEALVRFQGEGEYKMLTVSGIELHTWQEGEINDEEVFAYLHTGANDERVVVLASKQSSAVRAARILRGEEPNHASGQSLLSVSPAPGSFLYVATSGLPDIGEFSPASHVFGLAQGIQVDLGEAGGFLQAHVGVTTASPEDALNITGVVNGLVALARLAGSQATELVELLSGVSLSTRGSEVMIDFEFGVQRLLELKGELDEEW